MCVCPQEWVKQASDAGIDSKGWQDNELENFLLGRTKKTSREDQKRNFAADFIKVT